MYTLLTLLIAVGVILTAEYGIQKMVRHSTSERKFPGRYTVWAVCLIIDVIMHAASDMLKTLAEIAATACNKLFPGSLKDNNEFEYNSVHMEGRNVEVLLCVAGRNVNPDQLDDIARKVVHEIEPGIADASREARKIAPEDLIEENEVLRRELDLKKEEIKKATEAVKKVKEESAVKGRELGQVKSQLTRLQKSNGPGRRRHPQKNEVDNTVHVPSQATTEPQEAAKDTAAS